MYFTSEAYHNSKGFPNRLDEFRNERYRILATIGQVRSSVSEVWTSLLFCEPQFGISVGVEMRNAYCLALSPRQLFFWFPR
jgi:hypothetical protein